MLRVLWHCLLRTSSSCHTSCRPLFPSWPLHSFLSAYLKSLYLLISALPSAVRYNQLEIPVLFSGGSGHRAAPIFPSVNGGCLQSAQMHAAVGSAHVHWRKRMRASWAGRQAAIMCLQIKMGVASAFFAPLTPLSCQPTTPNAGLLKPIVQGVHLHTMHLKLQLPLRDDDCVTYPQVLRTAAAAYCCSWVRHSPLASWAPTLPPLPRYTACLPPPFHPQLPACMHPARPGVLVLWALSLKPFFLLGTLPQPTAQPCMACTPQAHLDLPVWPRLGLA